MQAKQYMEFYGPVRRNCVQSICFVWRLCVLGDELGTLVIQLKSSGSGKRSSK